MRDVAQPPANMVSVVLAPNRVSSLARPMRPERPVMRPSMPAARAAAVRRRPTLAPLRPPVPAGRIPEANAVSRSRRRRIALAQPFFR